MLYLIAVKEMTCNVKLRKCKIVHAQFLLGEGGSVKARLHRRFLSQQLDAIFVTLKPGFHIIAPVATIAAVVEKRVSATVAIYGNTLFSDSSDKYDSGDERRWDRKISISATVATAATVYFVNGNHWEF